MSTFLIYPYLNLIVAAAGCLIFYRRARVQAILSSVAAAIQVALALNLLMTVQNRGVQVLQIGGWPAPFGITLVADLTSALLALTTAMIFFAVNIYSTKHVSPSAKERGFYFLVNVLGLGATAAYLTGDIFNLYVSFEILLVASFMLLTIGGTREQITQGATYVVINLVGSFCFLVGVALLYGHTGNLNLAYLSSMLRAGQWTYGVRTASAFLFFAFALKAAMFPLFFWLPRSYSAASGAVGALFSSVLTLVGVYSMLRVFTLVFPVARDPDLQRILYFGALLSMAIGVLGAATQPTLKRILSVHIISQVGYMLWGLALFSPLSLAATLFFMVHNMVVKSNLFLIAGLIEETEGTDEVAQLGGMLSLHPFLASLFLLSALSLAGLPPLSGFFAKLFLVREGLGLADFAGVAVALGVSFLTLFSMTRIWNEVFLKDRQHPTVNSLPSSAGLAPLLFLALFGVLLGAVSGPLYEIFISAGETLFDPQVYVTAVLGHS